MIFRVEFPCAPKIGLKDAGVILGELPDHFFFRIFTGSSTPPKINMFLKRKQLKSNFHVPFRGDVSFQRGTSQDVFSPNDLYGQRKMSRLFVGLCALVR